MLSLVGAAVARAAETASAGTLVWCGLDYSQVKLIGTMDFRQPEEIFPKMLDAWNALFMKEMLPQLEKMAGAVETDLKAVEALNEKAGASQIEHEDGTRHEKVDATHITEKDLAKAVNAYKLKHDQGLGLVFFMDRLVKAQETACLYVVFFDIASRKVVYSERVCSQAGGMGFRNFWFRPVKTAVTKLPKMYQTAKAGK
jgi:hypothetical protein